MDHASSTDLCVTGCLHFLRRRERKQGSICISSSSASFLLIQALRAGKQELFIFCSEGRTGACCLRFSTAVCSSLFPRIRMGDCLDGSRSSRLREMMGSLFIEFGLFWKRSQRRIRGCSSQTSDHPTSWGESLGFERESPQSAPEDRRQERLWSQVPSLEDTG